MSLDPVCSSKYGNRPLLDLPALDVAGVGAGGSLMPASLQTMMAPSGYRPNPQDQQLALTGTGRMPGMVPGGGAPPLPAAAPMGLPALPNDWPYLSRLPGSLFAPPPGPTPYKNPQVFPYSFLHSAPFTMQPPPYHITDSAGQTVAPAMSVPNANPSPNPLSGITAGVGAGGMSLEAQQLSRLYPGVVDPLPPQGLPPGPVLGPAPGGLALPSGIVPQSLQVPEQKPVERVFFEGVLTYGELSEVHGQGESSTAYWRLPEFLRHELRVTYGHVPATDVKVVGRGGEFHVHALPRRRQAAWGEGRDREGGGGGGGGDSFFDGEDTSPDRRLIV